ncbi:outer membrane beta-barrel protein [Pelagibacterium montanilacus]|uniref:outer membrane beta-barrel protein n=1 Tax=Pelagibacterium montanilacus TaxID=2185280 RepID=UPI000F8DF1F0|nr:outer membrane beta-barrel protein [Pelagibacterium montanilacus]
MIRPHRHRLSLVAAAPLLVTGLGALAQGDGSHTDNLDLLRTSYSPFCEAAMLCHYGTRGAGDIPDRAAAAPVPAPAPVARTPAPGPVAPEPRPSLASVYHQPEAFNAPPAPPEPIQSLPFETEFALETRGTAVLDEEGTRFELGIIPSFALTRTGPGDSLDLRGSARLVRAEDDVQARSVEIDGAYGRQIDSVTAVALSGGLSVTDPDPDGLGGGGEVDAPVVTIEGEAGVSRRFGRLDASGQISAGRTVSEDETESGWRTGAGLRLGYSVSPILAPFIEARIANDRFDLGRSSTALSLLVGASAQWTNGWSGEAVIGQGWRRDDGTGATEADDLLFESSVQFDPNPTLGLRMAFDTSIEPGSADQGPRTTHGLEASADYRINPFLSLTARVEARWEDESGDEPASRRLGAGASGTLEIGPHVAASLSYDYAVRTDPAQVPAEADEHRIGAGLTLRR